MQTKQLHVIPYTLCDIIIYNTEPYSAIGEIVGLYKFTSTFRLNVCLFLFKIKSPSFFEALLHIDSTWSEAYHLKQSPNVYDYWHAWLANYWLIGLNRE